MSLVFVSQISLEGRDSAMGIATGFGLDGPAIEYRGRRDFRTCPDRPWGPTQPSTQWEPGLPRG